MFMFAAQVPDMKRCIHESTLTIYSHPPIEAKPWMPDLENQEVDNKCTLYL